MGGLSQLQAAIRAAEAVPYNLVQSASFLRPAVWDQKAAEPAPRAAAEKVSAGLGQPPGSWLEPEPCTQGILLCVDTGHMLGTEQDGSEQGEARGARPTLEQAAPTGFQKTTL